MHTKDKGRTRLLIHLPIEEDGDNNRWGLWRPDQAGFDDGFGMRSGYAFEFAIEFIGAGLEKAFRSKYGLSLSSYPVNEMRMLAAAAERAKSLEPVKIALALEGMEFESF